MRVPGERTTTVQAGCVGRMRVIGKRRRTTIGRSHLPVVSTKNCRRSGIGPFRRFIESFNPYNDKRHHSANNETHKQ